MRRYLCVLSALLALSLTVFAQYEYEYVEASELTLLGKVFPDTPNPYQRMDFTRFGGWDAKDVNLLEMPSGIIVSFKTDSPVIAVKPEFININNTNASGFASRGFDLYIKRDGKWTWAGGCSYDANRVLAEETKKERKLVNNMDGSMKECLMWLPIESKLASLKIAVKKGSTIEKGENPFRHRICLHGSSFMHGVSTTRAGQTVPAYLTRMTGMQFCSLGVSGDCRMQPQFAAALAAADVDAYVFDAFSNGSGETIKANLFNFIETLQAAKPGVPLIFMHSIWEERRNFDQAQEKKESDKLAVADSLMKIALKKYKDVYYIDSCAGTDTTVDGVHPSDSGYLIWAETLRKPILRILRKYGIR